MYSVTVRCSLNLTNRKPRLTRNNAQFGIMKTRLHATAVCWAFCLDKRSVLSVSSHIEPSKPVFLLDSSILQFLPLGCSVYWRQNAGPILPTSIIHLADLLIFDRFGLGPVVILNYYAKKARDEKRNLRPSRSSAGEMNGFPQIRGIGSYLTMLAKIAE